MYIIFVEQNEEFFITENPIEVINGVLPFSIDEEEIDLDNSIMMKILDDYGIYVSLVPDTPTFSFLFYVNWKGKHEFDFDIDKIKQDIEFYENKDDILVEKISNGNLNCYKIDEVKTDISGRHAKRFKTFHYTYYALNIPNEDSVLSLED